jgi:uncharacterized protein (DUF2345 family)
VRVVQPFAGPGYGSQFLPRIGHEVVVGYLEGDIDRPVVRASLHRGRGEGGTPTTPGGQGAEADTSVFQQSTDTRPSGQGNLSGGHSPAWHGAAAEGQANQAALSGLKTQEFGGSGYNQLVFDDTDGQLRTQFGTTQYATWLTLGHLIHQADNHRGSFRGLGFELRTDAWGSTRAPQGLFFTTYATAESDPAGDNAGARALAQQMVQLAETFNQAAQTHQTVQLSTHLGSSGHNENALGPLPPLKRIQQALNGMVSGASLDQAQQDAANANASTSAGQVPHTADGLIALSARGGLNITSQDQIQAANDTIHTGTGQDATRGIGGAYRLHTGQAIGVLGGAVQPGSEAAGTGLTLIAGQGDVNLQAQADAMQIAAKDLINVQSANGHIDFAAAKKITLKTEEGACVVIGGDDGFTAMAPGKIEVHAASKSMVGAADAPNPLAALPNAVCVSCLLKAAREALALAPRT